MTTHRQTKNASVDLQNLLIFILRSTQIIGLHENANEKNFKAGVFA
jgi:hypothetical protein